MKDIDGQEIKIGDIVQIKNWYHVLNNFIGKIVALDNNIINPSVTVEYNRGVTKIHPKETFCLFYRKPND